MSTEGASLSRRWTRAAAAIVAAVALAVCESPEAKREPGGGRGADVGNRDVVVEMHEGSDIYYETPCETTLPECTGSPPVGTARQTARTSK